MAHILHLHADRRPPRVELCCPSSRRAHRRKMPDAAEMPTLRTISADELPASFFEPVDPKAREQALAIIEDVKATGEESSKEQSLMLQNSRSQQSFTFCDK